ncbi:PDDEXK family nuclease [Metapseudomonas otitidis]|uniref:hypothetical protein n=1 Tax=Metapseudomonas otitidis TaxID=319939 RepID=UPI0020983EF4|nr:hypothetical protein [Pseudomonas otitidis]MCO7556186.1 hypothetical protein [Pseudomonas otitidis]
MGKGRVSALSQLIANGGRFRSAEAGVCQLVELLLQQGVFAHAAELPAVLHWEREYPLPRGRADFVLFHADGSITVLEVKKAGDELRAIRGAIGQVMSYAVQVGYARLPTAIRMMVAADVPGADSLLMSQACAAAGVQWLPLGTMDEHERPWLALMEVANG